MEVNPIPTPASPMAAAQAHRLVSAEKRTAITQPTIRIRPPAREKGFSPQRLDRRPQYRAPADQPKLRNIMTMPS